MPVSLSVNRQGAWEVFFKHQLPSKRRVGEVSPPSSPQMHIQGPGHSASVECGHPCSEQVTLSQGVVSQY